MTGSRSFACEQQDVANGSAFLTSCQALQANILFAPAAVRMTKLQRPWFRAAFSDAAL